MIARPWTQTVIEFADRQAAEHVAVERLRTLLIAAEADHAIETWWFIRKTPYWRLRYQPTTNSSDAAKHIAVTLDELVNQRRIVGWTASGYEPEVYAFGGSAGMHVAHDLFHHDSRHILDYLHRIEQLRRGRANSVAAPGLSTLGRRELAILLFSVLLRAAEQDWYEQGDVWAKVADLRPSSDSATYLSAAETERLKPSVRRLMTVDAGPTSSLMRGGGPLSALADWSTAFEQAGHRLADLARRGTLERGLRAVLAHHVIFHWNRLGLPRADQVILSTLTKEVVMGTNDNASAATAASAPQQGTGPASVGEVTTDTTELADMSTTAEAGAVGAEVDSNAETSPESLSSTLVDTLREQGTVRTERVEAALRAVPRHLFVPEVPLETAYADDAVYTKQDGVGTSISAASQPTIVAMMLEQLQVEPGDVVLELGAGTGYNAALLGHLVGDHGRVITMDVDQDLVDRARTSLSTAGVKNVRAILGDGALGYPASAPYDRIIATVGAWGLPSPWLDQLAPRGRLVAPLRIRGSVSRSMVFERTTTDNNADDSAPRRWRCVATELCTFMPLRGGIADDARRMIPLAPDGAVTLQAHQEQAVDPTAVLGVLDQPHSIEAWTGVTFRNDESMEWMELWLTCTIDNALCRMPVERSAIDRGLVKPQFGWGSVAITQNADLAYLTIRPATPTAGGGKRYEIGVIGHGSTSNHLANQVADAISTWNLHHRSQEVDFELQQPPKQSLTPGKATQIAPGEFAIDTSLHRLAIRWQ